MYTVLVSARGPCVCARTGVCVCVRVLTSDCTSTWRLLTLVNIREQHYTSYREAMVLVTVYRADGGVLPASSVSSGTGYVSASQTYCTIWDILLCKTVIRVQRIYWNS